MKVRTTGDCVCELIPKPGTGRDECTHPELAERKVLAKIEVHLIHCACCPLYQPRETQEEQTMLEMILEMARGSALRLEPKRCDFIYKGETFANTSRCFAVVLDDYDNYEHMIRSLYRRFKEVTKST